MSRYINIRVRKSDDSKKWVVEGQSLFSGDWDVLLRYSTDRDLSEDKAKTAACKLAQDFSKKEKQPVIAYDADGHRMAVYAKGEPCNGVGRL